MQKLETKNTRQNKIPTAPNITWMAK